MSIPRPRPPRAPPFQPRQKETRGTVAGDAIPDTPRRRKHLLWSRAIPSAVASPFHPACAPSLAGSHTARTNTLP